MPGTSARITNDVSFSSMSTASLPEAAPFSENKLGIIMLSISRMRSENGLATSCIIGLVLLAMLAGRWFAGCAASDEAARASGAARFNVLARAMRFIVRRFSFVWYGTVCFQCKWSRFVGKPDV